MKVTLLPMACLLVEVLCVSSGWAMDSAERDRAYAAEEQSSRKMATLTYMNASAPLGRFLLVRKGRDVCALRFTEFHRGHDAKPPSLFHSGEETLYAEYDWFYQGDGSGDFTKADVESGHRKLVRKPLVGLIHPFVFQTGTVEVRCGPFVLSWLYPNNVGFRSWSQKRDESVDLAPTSGERFLR